MKKVYISGPMTGLPYLNRPRFESAAGKVTEFGLTPVNPHNLCDPSWDWQKCMRADIAALCDCDAIFLLRGWEMSNGAQLELNVAHRLGLRILTSIVDVDKYARACGIGAA
jgi:Domain of unknown function (DUF4406)